MEMLSLLSRTSRCGHVTTMNNSSVPLCCSLWSCDHRGLFFVSWSAWSCHHHKGCDSEKGIIGVSRTEGEGDYCLVS